MKKQVRNLAVIDQEINAARKMVSKLANERQSIIEVENDLTKIIKVGDVFVSRSDRYYFAFVVAVKPSEVTFRQVFASGDRLVDYGVRKNIKYHFFEMCNPTGGTWRKTTKTKFLSQLEKTATMTNALVATIKKSYGKVTK